MGNIVGNRMALTSFPQNILQPKDKYESIDTFKFHDILPEETNNGLYLCESYFPEEVVTIILSHVDPKHLLKCSEVCRKWCNIIKSDTFWANLYYRRTQKKPKKLPWYIYYCYLTTDYFDRNLIRNGNGQEQFKHWKIIQNYGDQFRIEDPPVGADPLPTDVPEFCGKTSCFATSYYECNKLQEINLENNRILQLIINRYKPHIYLSEWVAGRFDCGCVYNLWCKLYGTASDNNKEKTRRTRTYSGSSDEYDEDFEDEGLYEGETLLLEQNASHRIEQWAGSSWTQIEMLIARYPSGVKRIVFQHEGRDTQFWKGHYGSKMAGAVLKIVFNSIKPLTD